MNVDQIIEQLTNGAETTLEGIINKHQKKVYNTCLNLVQNEKDAEELTQDVFMKMIENSSSFKGAATVSTWLYKITINECLQFLRKKKAKKRFGFLTGIWDKNETEAVDFIHPGVALEQKENIQYLFKAIKKLPEKQQVVFTLKNIEMLSQQDIATILEITEGAVESLLQRAKQNLKKELTNIK